MNKAPILTSMGQSFLIRALAGAQIVFTKMKIGNGDLNGATGMALTDLINPLVSFGIAGIDTSEENFVKISARFDSTNIPSDFRWKELGLFVAMGDTEAFDGDGSAKTFTLEACPDAVSAVKVNNNYTEFIYDADIGVVTLENAPSAGAGNVVVVYPTGPEYLYAYSNDGDDAGVLKPNSSDVISEQTINLTIAVGNAESVTAVLSDSVLYASKEAFNAHTANTQNPHSVTKEQVELGNVPNVSTNDQTPTFSTPTNLTNISSGEKLATILGKVRRALSALIDHIANKNNPHSVTAEQVAAAGKEHTHKAADITSGALGISRGGTGATTAAAARTALGLSSVAASGKYSDLIGLPILLTLQMTAANAISSNTDFNTIIEPGCYHIDGSDTYDSCLNTPWKAISTGKTLSSADTTAYRSGGNLYVVKIGATLSSNTRRFYQIFVPRTPRGCEYFMREIQVASGATAATDTDDWYVFTPLKKASAITQSDPEIRI